MGDTVSCHGTTRHIPCDLEATDDVPTQLEHDKSYTYSINLIVYYYLHIFNEF